MFSLHVHVTWVDGRENPDYQVMYNSLIANSRKKTFGYRIDAKMEALEGKLRKIIPVHLRGHPAFANTFEYRS